MTTLESRLGYEFKDRTLFERALTHSSFVNEHGMSKLLCNERLEFLGDSVLSVIVSRYLFEKYSDKPEGELTRERAALVCEATLAGFSRELNLGAFIKFGKGEKMSGGDSRPSILADAFEAMLAAIYLDGGFDTAEQFVLRFVKNAEPQAEQNTRDYKTLLQEVIQRNPDERLRYVVTDESGPDHNKSFTVEIQLNNNTFGVGHGRSKKLAEQDAARQALELMGL